jgi:hypothetical protein
MAFTDWRKKYLGSKLPRLKNPEEVIRFYQQIGFFIEDDPEIIVQKYADDYGAFPDPDKPWDDVFMLAHSTHNVWADDPEADVCAENLVYSKVVPEWANISGGAFPLNRVEEQWESKSGPITLRLYLNDKTAIVKPNYQDDWIDLEILQQINGIIAASGRQFECAVDGNFSLVLCLTAQQRKTLKEHRQFPFAW